MKLRLRALESRETLKLELPNSSTVHDLKQALAGSLPPSSLPLHLSLNRKDELSSSAPAGADSLQALGITSGDLIFYTSQDNAFAVAALPREAPPIGAASSQQPNLELEPKPPVSGSIVSSSSKVNAECSADVPDSAASSSSCELNSSGNVDLLRNETLVREKVDSLMKDAGTEDGGSKSDPNLQSSEVLDEPQLQENDVDGDEMDVDGEIDWPAAYKYSEPCFLRRVLREELRDDGEHRLLVIAVHAVMLESGFVAFDSVTGSRVDRFHLPDQWPSTAFTISLQYTLPDLLDSSGANAIEGVVLKFQSLGHFLNVYGSLVKGKAGLHRVCLDEYRFAPTIDLMWANCDKNENRNNTCSSSYPENEVFEFWKILKDGLALPLLIDLCERANLSLPSCFMCLPTELKLQICELLPGADLAKVGCVSSEMRYLSSNTDLWRKKFEEEFGVGPESNFHWKVKFASYWEARKKRKRESERSRWIGGRSFVFPAFRDPNRGMFPNFLGGGYDQFPGFGASPSYGFGGRPAAFPGVGRRNVRPGCNLGGRNI